MLRTSFVFLGVLLSAGAAAGRPSEGLRDPYFGEALYYANQGRYFEALARLDTELAQHYGLDQPKLDSLQYHVKDAEFDVGDFELDYRMHQRAGRAIRAVLDGDVEDSVRNEAAFRLARIHFQKDQLDDALVALNRIQGRMPDRIRDQVEFLRANLYMATGRPSDAVDVLKGLQDAKTLNGFAAYNFGIALLEDGRSQQALEQLDRAGEVDGADEATLAIRDKSNLVLGKLLMEDQDFVRAQQVLDRVRLKGPLSNQALLSAGWADMAANNYQRAIVPWSVLVGREPTDAAVQEAKLALPYAYSQLHVYGRAALLYGEGLELFDGEIKKLDASIDSIRKGRFLKALVREEIRQDKDWVIRLRSLPETPETYYLMQLMASHDFQTALQNYLDLEDLRMKLESWQRSFDAYEDLIRLRREYYEPLLPEIDAQFRRLDSKIRLRRQQHELLQRRLQGLLVTPRPDFLATTEERGLAAQIAEIEQALAGDESAPAAALRARAERLRGLLTWTLWTEYDERLTVFDEHLRDLQDAIDVMAKQYESFVRIRQAAVHSYVGYEAAIRRLRTRVREASAGVKLLMARQGHLLEVVAINELTKRRELLENYRDQARYAMADSYDRATKAKTASEQQR